jgi:hypothetical protein
MVVKLYVLNVFRDESFIRGSDSAAVLDFDDVPALQRQLNGHLEGHLRRSGTRRDQWHEYALDVFPSDREGKATGAARIFRWYLPYATEEGL